MAHPMHPPSPGPPEGTRAVAAEPSGSLELGMAVVQRTLEHVDGIVRRVAKPGEATEWQTVIHPQLRASLSDLLPLFSSQTVQEALFTLRSIAPVLDQMQLPTVTYMDLMRIRSANRAACQFFQVAGGDLSAPDFSALSLLSNESVVPFLRQASALLTSFPAQKSFRMRVQAKVRAVGGPQLVECVVENNFVFGVSTGILFAILSFTPLVP
eukprot:TRINITY_DN14119_c0_g1_i1.p1 TRINITY_DN14119_c0_g1~~TRINITY_DN14119_c0_g1_i1.p1  ORF type:complete len:237 (-),score=58.02 TRINITY_DN14119_c0_g1_i1:22-654(-)